MMKLFQMFRFLNLFMNADNEELERIDREHLWNLFLIDLKDLRDLFVRDRLQFVDDLIFLYPKIQNFDKSW